MKLPADSIIAESKITRYLVVPQARGDKSAFLRRAGYSLENADALLKDLRTQILPLEATPLEASEFGEYHEIRGMLKGPNGAMLTVRTIWMTERLTGATKFITLMPDRPRRI